MGVICQMKSLRGSCRISFISIRHFAGETDRPSEKALSSLFVISLWLLSIQPATPNI